MWQKEQAVNWVFEKPTRFEPQFDSWDQDGAVTSAILGLLKCVQSSAELILKQD